MPKRITATEFFEFKLASAQARHKLKDELRSLTPESKNTLIDQWHGEMQHNLMDWSDHVDLRPMTAYFKKRIKESEFLESLSNNPLLCTAICTLNWMRNGNLPKSSVEVCEKICEVLLNRSLKNYSDAKTSSDDYEKLSFQIRRGLVTKIAHYMVNLGECTISHEEIDKQISEELPTYNQLTDRHKINASAIRKAFIERSGILQESSDQKIEFVDSTLKYFLAAQRFVNLGDSQTLANNCEEDSFKQVIQFAIDLTDLRSKFNMSLAKAIVDRPVNTNA